MTKLLATALFSAGLMLSAQPAAAQDANDLRIRVGIGAQTSPEFPGADKNEWGPLPEFSFARGTEQFDVDSPDQSFGISLIDAGPFTFGPALNIEGSRKESDVGEPVGKVKTTVEVGAFAQYDLSDSFRLRAEGRKGLGGHDGLVGYFGGDYIVRDGDRYVFTLGPRIMVSNSRYQRAYFGVTPAAALASGLPVYDPDGGVHGVALASSGHVQFGTSPFGMFGYARYERLVGDAADSPIVRELGSRNQYSAGLGVSYTFTIARD